MARMECVGPTWESKWRGLGGRGRGKRSPGNGEAEAQALPSLLKELVAEPRLRLDQGLFTTM